MSLKLKGNSRVGRAQDVPDMHRRKLGNRRATLRFCPTYDYFGLHPGYHLSLSRVR